MIFSRKNRALLAAIAAQLEYHQKLLESILETLDAGQKQSIKRKQSMQHYFDQVRSTISAMGGNPDAPMLKPLFSVVDLLREDQGKE